MVGGIIAQRSTAGVVPFPVLLVLAYGKLSGGDAITIYGAHFTGTTSVTIGGVACTSVVVVDDGTITCVTPAGTAGAKDVVVTTPMGIGTLAGGFTFVAAPGVSGATLTPSTGGLNGGTAVAITGATGLKTGATLTVGGVATLITVTSATTATFVPLAVASGATGAKDVVITNPDGQSGTKTGGYTYTLSGSATVTTWATFLDALYSGAVGLSVLLSSTDGIVAQANVISATRFSFVGWIDLSKASTTLINEMISAITGSSPVAQAPGASGGLVLAVAANSVACCGLNGVSVDGADREMLADIVWDTVDDASMATSAGFWAGFRARGIATNSTTLIAGGIGKSSASTYRPYYFFDQIATAPSASNGPTAISAGAVVSGVVVTCFYVANQGLNVASGDGAANYGGCRVPTQTTGTALVSGTTTAAHSSRTDLQPCWGNSGTDGSNVVRLKRFKVFGECQKI